MSLIERHIQQFVERCRSLDPARFRSFELAEYAFLIEPRLAEVNAPASGGKDIPLCIMALTHGVEVAGVAVLNELLCQIGSGLVNPTVRFCLALGNPWAAFEAKRFIERDLNRSFANPSAATKREEQRAAILEPILSRSAWFLDVHQTKELCPQPFFIFPYSLPGYRFARHVAPQVAVITRKGGAFSKEGMCSDEFVNSVGGAGITIELGQNGFTPMALGVGLSACIRAIAFVQARTLSPEIAETDAVWSKDLAPVYTWAAVMDYPESGEVLLRDDLVNFTAVRSGETLGTHDGAPILAAADGPILFPQHYRDRSLPRPKELVRILKMLDGQEIKSLG
jgi:succinylglutamate desuccinylase